MTDVEKSIKEQMEELEKRAVTRYTDFYGGEEQKDDLQTYEEKNTVINDFLNNNELEAYYELLEVSKKKQFHNE